MSTQADILDLVGQDTRLRRVASTHGGEHVGACPFCGGWDRFRMWPEQGRFWCRRWGQHGDAIQYLRDHDRLSFAEACRCLGAEPIQQAKAGPAPPEIRVPDDSPPSEAWQKRARAFSEWAQEQLWGMAGEKVLEYLCEKRGLSGATVTEWDLGFSSRDWKDKPEARGLSDGQPVRLHRGIVIPCQEQGGIWYVKVRQPLKGDSLDASIGGGLEGKAAKYTQIRGGKAALFGARTLPGHDAAFLCEGEFDAMLLEQEAGDLVGVATMGSAQAQLAGCWLWALRDCRRIFAAQDADDAGTKGADRLLALSARVRLARPLVGKDVTDFHMAGGKLKDWVRYHLGREALPGPTTRVPPMVAEHEPTEVHRQEPPGCGWAGRVDSPITDSYKCSGGVGDRRV